MEIVRYLRHLNIVLRKHRTLMFLSIIFGIGLWFRLSNISLYTWQLIGYDESRDVLVARHIVEYGDVVWRGPYASGSKNMLMNSPVYYYFMAALWFIGRSPVVVLALWSLLLASIMYFAYRVGTLVWDNTLGIIMALLFAVQPTLISNSRHNSQPYVLTLFFMIFLWAYWKKSSMTLTRLCFLVALLMIPMHFHYGILLMFPAAFLLLGVEWLKLVATSKAGWLAKISPILVGEYFIFTWVWLTYWQTPFDQQLFLFREISRDWVSVVTQMQSAVVAMLDNLWWSKDIRVVIGILVCFVGVTGWHFYKQKHDNVTREKYWWMVLFAIVPPVVAGFHGDIIHTSYMLGVLPVLLMLIAIGIRVIMANNRYIALIVVFLVVGVFSEQALTVNAEAPTRSYYLQLQDVSRALYDDYRKIEPQHVAEASIALAVVSQAHLPLDKWGTSAMWYFLEDYFNKRLVSLSDYGTNFVSVIQKPRYFYVLCDYRVFAQSARSECIQKFRNARTYLLDGETMIYTSGEFDVWRFRIDETQEIGDYNVVYPR